MADRSKWTGVDADNILAADSGWPEGMQRSDVNDRAREVMGALYRDYSDQEFSNLCEESGDTFTLSRVSGTTIRVNVATDPTSKFTAGAWLRLTGTVATPAVVLCRIASIGAYAGSQIDVVVDTIRVPGTWTTEASLPAWTALSTIEIHGRNIKEAAFHPVGATLAQLPGEIPTIDDLSTVVTKTEGAGGLIDADLLDGQEGSYYENVLLSQQHNDVVNGDMSVWADGSSFTTPTDNTYVADEVRFLEEAAGQADVARVSSSSGDILSRYFLRATSVAVNNKFGLFGVIESHDSARYPGGVASLSFSARSSVGPIGNIRAYILEWTGTADTFGASLDPISAWGVEGAVETMAGSWNIVGSGSLAAGDLHATSTALSTTNFERYKLENQSVAAAAKNLAWLIVVDDTSRSASHTFELGLVQLEASTAAAPFQYISVGENVDRCQRHYVTTYEDGVAPGTVTNVGRIHHPAADDHDFLANEAILTWSLPTRMRVTPTVLPWSPVTGVSGEVDGNGTDWAATEHDPGPLTAAVIVTGDPTIGVDLACHMTADARYA